MAKYKATTKVIIDNEQHQSDGYISIILVNNGDCNALVNENLQGSLAFHAISIFDNI